MDGTSLALFQKLIDEQCRRNHDLIEMMCERMLVTPGDRGILVEDNGDGTISAELSDEVPFGQICYKSARSWSL